MADAFDKMASEFLSHPDYQPSPRPPPLGVLARRQPHVPRTPEAMRLGQLRRAAGAQRSHPAAAAAAALQRPSTLGRCAWGGQAACHLATALSDCRGLKGRGLGKPLACLPLPQTPYTQHG
jgi:hypothetical protein